MRLELPNGQSLLEGRDYTLVPSNNVITPILKASSYITDQRMLRRFRRVLRRMGYAVQ